MSVSSGTYTIKLSGGNYSTWAAACDDITNLTGDLTFTADASAFTEDVAPGAMTESLNGHTLTFTAATFPTTTNGATGPRFTLNYANRFFDNQMEGPGTITIEGIVALEGSSLPPAMYYMGFVSTAHTFNVRRCVMKGSSYGIWYEDSTVVLNCYNNIFMVTTNSDGGIYIKYALTGHVSNNTIDEVNDSNRGIRFNSAEITGLIENNIIYGPFLYNDFANITAATGNNNTSYDASCADENWAEGTNNRESQTADPFVDLDNQDYTLAAASDPIGNGKDLSGKFTTDFFGTTRTTWDIGAVFYQEATTTTTTTTTTTIATTTTTTIATTTTTTTIATTTTTTTIATTTTTTTIATTTTTTTIATTTTTTTIATTTTTTTIATTTTTTTIATTTTTTTIATTTTTTTIVTTTTTTTIVTTTTTTTVATTTTTTTSAYPLGDHINIIGDDTATGPEIIDDLSENLLICGDLEVKGSIHAGDGVDFDGVITNLTIVNGIITAAS